MKKYSVKESGQTLFELVMAIAVGVVIVTAVMVLTTLSINNSTFSKSNATALRFTQEGLEWVRTERDKSWETLLSKSGATAQFYCISTLSFSQSGQCTTSQTIAGTTYIRDLSLTSHDYDGDSTQETIDAEVIITWVDGKGTHNSHLKTQLTKWRINE